MKSTIKNFNNQGFKINNAGYRVNRNGSVIPTIEKDAFTSETYLGQFYKDNGFYYYFNRKQGNVYVYLPN